MVRWPWLALLVTLAACYRHAELPSEPPAEALLGKCSAGVDRAKLCGEWADAVASCQGPADEHLAFPELAPSACFVPVRYQPGKLPKADPVSKGCGYPSEDRAATIEHLKLQAADYQRIERGDGSSLPMALDCGLSDSDREVAATVNGRALARLAERLQRGERFAYSAVATFGFGHGAHDMSELRDWRPGDACIELGKWQMDLLSMNRDRVGRAAEAYHGRVAPVVVVSGGAVHSELHEAFMHHYLASCWFSVPSDAILLDPCADHTHTNVRNTGALVRQLAGRTAYIVTSDGLQAKYLQEWTVFSLIGGSIDQRALRDWGYLLGSWRQASVGIDAGFWYTPYRFWGEPATGLGSAACLP
jgi:hypothetical protein